LLQYGTGPVAGRILLAEEGFTVDRADNGRGGLFLPTDSQFDPIVRHRILPGMDGLALLKAMRAATPFSPMMKNVAGGAA
jgi:two-component system OmpR family response regulator